MCLMCYFSFDHGVKEKIVSNHLKLVLGFVHFYEE